MDILGEIFAVQITRILGITMSSIDKCDPRLTDLLPVSITTTIRFVPIARLARINLIAYAPCNFLMNYHNESTFDVSIQIQIRSLDCSII